MGLSSGGGNSGVGRLGALKGLLRKLKNVLDVRAIRRRFRAGTRALELPTFWSQMLVLRDLEQFVVLADELNFRHAAARLHISQPTLTQTIQRLERFVGSSLIERTTRQSRLTEAGQTLARGARLLLRDAETLARDVRHVAAGRRRQLRLGAVNPALRRMVPNVLHDVHTQYPDLRISLHPMASHQQLRALRESRIDIAIVRTAESLPGFVSEILMHEPLFAVLPSDHALAGQSSVDLEQLNGLDFVMAPRDRNPEFYDELISLYTRRNCSPSTITEADNMHAQLALVGAGVGVAVQPLLFVDRDRSDIVFRPVNEELRIPLQLLRPASDETEITQAFLTSARACTQALVADAQE